MKELKGNDALLNHFRKFAKDKEFRIYESQIDNYINKDNPSLNSFELKNKKNTTIKDLREHSVIPFFSEFQNRSNHSKLISEALIEKIIKEPEYQRKVDESLILMNVKEITYSAGLENSQIFNNIFKIRNDMSLNKKIKVYSFSK